MTQKHPTKQLGGSVLLQGGKKAPTLAGRLPKNPSPSALKRVFESMDQKLERAESEIDWVLEQQARRRA
jgi:hypothetical protein